MAKKTTQSMFGKKFKKANNAVKNNETTYNNTGNLPGGIRNGIAKVVSCKVDVFKSGPDKGEQYFRCAAVTVEPKKVDGIPVEGIQTSYMEALCDTAGNTPKNFEEHLDNVYNFLRQMGIDTAEFDGEDDFTTAMSDLVEAAPHIRFSTSLGKSTPDYPDPKVFENWGGVVDYEEDEDDDDIVDETDVTVEDEPEKDEEEETEEEETEDDEEEEETEDDDEEEDEDEEEEKPVDLKAMGKLADKDEDEDAIEAISDAAELVDVDCEDFEKWVDAVKAILKAQKAAAKKPSKKVKEEEEETEDEDDDDDDFEPEKGETYLYKPVGKRKPVECEVTSRNKSQKTCNLKNLATNKTYKAVSWDKLESDD